MMPPPPFFRHWRPPPYPYPPPPPPPPHYSYPPAHPAVDMSRQYQEQQEAGSKVETPYLQHQLLDAPMSNLNIINPNHPLDPLQSTHVDAHTHDLRSVSSFTGEDALEDEEQVGGEENAVRVLCIADIRGNLSHINQLADKVGATAVIHVGDFGFYGILLLLPCLSLYS